MRILVKLLVEAYGQWRRHNAQELGAALAYYTVFSLAPLLVVVIAVAGLVFGADAARGEIFAQFRDLIGPDGAQALEGAVRSASHPTSGMIAVAVGLIVLMLGAGGVFGQLQASLDRIWNVSGPGGWREMVRSRLLGFAMVLAVGFLLLVSLVISAALAALGRWLGGFQTGYVATVHAIETVLSYGVITMLFAVMFKFLPHARISWRSVWMGSIITAALFSVGKELIALYITRSQFGAAYGVAGSILVILTWIYYSSQIFLFGAECTQVYARRFGSGIRGRFADSPVDADPPAAAAQPRPVRGPAARRRRNSTPDVQFLPEKRSAADREHSKPL